MVAGHRYLHDCLHCQFPDLRLRAARQVEQREAAEARTQEVLQGQLQVHCQGYPALARRAEEVLNMLVSDMVGSRKP